VLPFLVHGLYLGTIIYIDILVNRDGGGAAWCAASPCTRTVPGYNNI
jgi:hypothetical protein